MRLVAIAVLCSLAGAQQDRTARELLEQLRSPRDDVREAAAEKLVQLGKASVPPLIGALQDGVALDEPDDVRRAQQIGRVLARLGAAASAALPTLDAAITATVAPPTENHTVLPATRRAVLFELLRARAFVAGASRTSTADLIEDLAADDPFTRERAAQLLGARGAEARAAVPALVAGLHPRLVNFNPLFVRGSEAVVRAACAHALIRIAPDSPEVGSAYIALLGDDDPAVRREAVMALGRLGERVPANAYFLQPSLADADPRVVRETITALGMLGGSAAKAIPDLERLAGSDDRQIAARAAAALRQIRGQ